MLIFDHHLFFLSWISQNSIFFIALPWSRLQEHCAPCHPQIHPEKLNVSAVPPRALESQTKKSNNERLRASSNSDEGKAL